MKIGMFGSTGGTILSKYKIHRIVSLPIVSLPAVFRFGQEKSNRYGEIYFSALPDMKNYKEYIIATLKSNKLIIAKPGTHQWSLQTLLEHTCLFRSTVLY
jgi:hypothetical protein